MSCTWDVEFGGSRTFVAADDFWGIAEFDGFRVRGQRNFSRIFRTSRIAVNGIWVDKFVKEVFLEERNNNFRRLCAVRAGWFQASSAWN